MTLVRYNIAGYFLLTLGPCHHVLYVVYNRNSEGLDRQGTPGAPYFVAHGYGAD